MTDARKYSTLEEANAAAKARETAKAGLVFVAPTADGMYQVEVIPANGMPKPAGAR